MPISRRLPKRGFHNLFSKDYQIVNLRDLERLGETTHVTSAALAEHGLVRYGDRPVKLLGDGKIARAYTVEVDKASRSAIAAIEAAGGTVKVPMETGQSKR